ncbi:hypothetical protein [Deinococcus sp. Leaf326]|uniref:hypothetical protein n=1 Tax=Deinococcus sp. Leaf326 TaxID=1736338 RepID=UPI0006F6432E|nr:hypothetical protein [Deinococcus sp. Leaf326]KQR37810.1 hypothetical protein ASF71_15120 [Deinococcus sp. Leaf326]
MYFATLNHLNYLLAQFLPAALPLTLTVDGVRHQAFELTVDGDVLVVSDLGPVADAPLRAGDLAEVLRGSFGHLPGTTQLVVEVPGRGRVPLMEDVWPVIEAVGSERAYPARLRCA